MLINTVHRRARVRLVLVLLAASCGGPSPAAPRPPVPQNQCAPGVSIPASQVCSGIVPSCPVARPATARTVTLVSTCGLEPGESTCTPIALPSCASTTNRSAHFLLAATGTLCVGEVWLDVEPTAAGGASIRWRSQQLGAPSGACQPIGSERSGGAEIAGPCCERVVDIEMPVSRRMFRIVVRTDWSS